MKWQAKIKGLQGQVESIYLQHPEVGFNGWSHVFFVWQKTAEFARANRSNSFLACSAALTHDLNYLVELHSKPEVGAELRSEILRSTNFTTPEIQRIERIILEAHTAYRNDLISLEAQALSDADTLFKALPITPILFAHKYLAQTGMNVQEMAQKIVQEQNVLMENGIYFYTDAAKAKYLKWAIVNLHLWNNVLESLDDPDIRSLITPTDNAASVQRVGAI